jgi:hypothetical protein
MRTVNDLFLYHVLLAAWSSSIPQYISQAQSTFMMWKCSRNVEDGSCCVLYNWHTKVSLAQSKSLTISIHFFSNFAFSSGYLITPLFLLHVLLLLHLGKNTEVSFTLMCQSQPIFNQFLLKHYVGLVVCNWAYYGYWMVHARSRDIVMYVAYVSSILLAYRYGDIA